MSEFVHRICEFRTEDAVDKNVVRFRPVVRAKFLHRKLGDKGYYVYVYHVPPSLPDHKREEKIQECRSQIEKCHEELGTHLRPGVEFDSLPDHKQTRCEFLKSEIRRLEEKINRTIELGGGRVEEVLTDIPCPVWEFERARYLNS